MLRTGLSLVGIALSVGCTSKRPPPPVDFVFQQEAGMEAGLKLGPPGPPPDDAGGLCGRLKIPIVLERPNLYFVLDASGSMQSDMDKPNANNFLPTRYDAASQAIESVLLSIGHRIRYGVALFPTISDGGLSCLPGTEVFPTVAGDPVSVGISGKAGPLLLSLLDLLRHRPPFGGTPTAFTLRALESKILALPGKTNVILLTDGAPNCDATTGCTAAGCSINIEGHCSSTDPTINCCDPSSGGSGNNLDCVDADATLEAIADYASKKVPVYVIGLPGTKYPYYQNLLDRMAQAGGTARSTKPFYYTADGTDDITSALQDVGLRAISCEIDLRTPPPDPRLVNVYFDSTVVVQSATNGWTWVTTADGGTSGARDSGPNSGGDADAGAPSRIEIVGEKCDQLKRGDVIEVQVVAGCPSVIK